MMQILSMFCIVLICWFFIERIFMKINKNRDPLSMLNYNEQKESINNPR